jgi:hypothetical protein
MVKIWSDFLNLHTWHHVEAACFFHVVKSLVITYKSRGPDQELQRRQHVHRHTSVQQALVLVQMNNSET